MKKKCFALAMLFMMTLQHAKAAEDEPRQKSECEKALEACKAVSLKAPSSSTSKNEGTLALFCDGCKQKCSKKFLEGCARDVKANPKEMENFDSFKVHHLNCVNMCKK
ncbi:MAG TPA: hypothetical protein VMW10_13090 [Alphaproteobacteria bacterium]|nr:hypothetical protein [Alphaproteobacteria bacterium]